MTFVIEPFALFSNQLYEVGILQFNYLRIERTAKNPRLRVRRPASGKDPFIEQDAARAKSFASRKQTTKDFQLSSGRLVMTGPSHHPHQLDLAQALAQFRRHRRQTLRGAARR